MRFTDEEKRIAAEREVGWRKRVYPNRIETGRLSQQEADYQIQIMQEIADDYRTKAEFPL